MRSIFKLKDLYVDRVWGYEKWVLSTHKNGSSFVEGEEKNLYQYIGKELPILIKEIKAYDRLSVQVHPTDEYAKKNENDNGKTECWYITNANEDATLICGVEEGLNKDNFLNIVKHGEIEKYLTRIKVKKGDMIYIPAGTIHAIEGGLELIEIQQSSDITYRIYDWGRDREIHVNKAVNVINFNKIGNYGKIKNFTVLNTPYFTVEKLNINNIYTCKSLNCNYHIYICLEGEGSVTDNNINININKGDCVYVKDNVEYSIKGNMELLKIY